MSMHTGMMNATFMQTPAPDYPDHDAYCVDAHALELSCALLTCCQNALNAMPPASPSSSWPPRRAHPWPPSVMNLRLPPPPTSTYATCSVTAHKRTHAPQRTHTHTQDVPALLPRPVPTTTASPAPTARQQPARRIRRAWPPARTPARMHGRARSQQAAIGALTGCAAAAAMLLPLAQGDMRRCTHTPPGRLRTQLRLACVWTRAPTKGTPVPVSCPPA